MGNEVDLGLRSKVAELDGWRNIEIFSTEGEIKGLMDIELIKARNLKSDAWYAKVPKYEMSFDAIAEVCDRHNVGFDLKGWVDDKEGYKYSASYSGDDIAIVGGIGFTRAIAVCHLFVAVMIERSRQKERVTERDRLVKALALRQKVATLAGWTDFFIGEVYHELSGIPPLGASRARTPHYEEDNIAIIRLLLANGVEYDRDPRADHVGAPSKNMIYTDNKTGIAAYGETCAIALCNLFVAVMESRLAGKNFGAEPKHDSMKQELVKIEAPFTRGFLQHVREKANWQINTLVGRNWIDAHIDIARAVDRLDAMLARKELI